MLLSQFKEHLKLTLGQNIEQKAVVNIHLLPDITAGGPHSTGRNLLLLVLPLFFLRIWRGQDIIVKRYFYLGGRM